jgi:hypothetical protein
MWAAGSITARASPARLGCRIEEVEAEAKRPSTNELWADQVRHLIQLPGLGMQVVMTVLAAIGVY